MKLFNKNNQSHDLMKIISNLIWILLHISDIQKSRLIQKIWLWVSNNIFQQQYFKNIFTDTFISKKNARKKLCPQDN